MKYVAFVGTDGPQPPEALAVMNRDAPAYLEEMDRRGVRVFGRELELPEKAATVRVRNGETLVSDGPFAETKEFVAGLDLLDCVDLDEAIEVEAKSPVARFLPFEIRPLREGLRLGPRASAFGRGDDAAGIPYLLMVWMGGTPAAPLDEQAVMQECEAWRQELEACGVFVLGTALGGPETATTMRFRDGEMQLSDGPFLDIAEYIADVEVVSCADRKQAIELAAAHPFTRYHAIEVRPFYSESRPETAV
jgi:hypothetical protein